MAEDPVLDDEELYRSVRGSSDDDAYYYDSAGKVVIVPKAFFDRGKKPSVDRARLREFNPEKSKKSEGDGIVGLLTDDIRRIGDVLSNDNGKSVRHTVDVISDPVTSPPEELNEAHALIVVDPEYFGSETKQRKAFKKLRISLARLATRSGWVLEPQDS